MASKFKCSLFVAALLIGGCGQTGPLFIPEPKPINQEQEGNENAPDNQKKTDKKDG